MPERLPTLDVIQSEHTHFHGTNLEHPLCDASSMQIDASAVVASITCAIMAVVLLRRNLHLSLVCLCMLQHFCAGEASKQARCVLLAASAVCCLPQLIPASAGCATVGVTPMEAQLQRSEQANRYAEVVRGVNKVLVTESQDQFDAVNAFLAACPEEDNG